MPHFESDPLGLPARLEWPGGADETATPFVDEFGGSPEDGVAVESLSPGTALDVTTQNTRYRLVVMDPEGHALVTGGRLFPDPTEVRIEGSTAGGNALKLGWICVGLRLEMTMGLRTVTTSPIQSIAPAA